MLELGQPAELDFELDSESQLCRRAAQSPVFIVTVCRRYCYFTVATRRTLLPQSLIMAFHFRNLLIDLYAPGTRVGEPTWWPVSDSRGHPSPRWDVNLYLGQSWVNRWRLPMTQEQKRWLNQRNYKNLHLKTFLDSSFKSVIVSLKITYTTCRPIILFLRL